MTGTALPPGADVADLLSAHGVWLHRVSDDDSRDGRVQRWLVAYPCPRARVDAALETLRAAAGCETFRVRGIGEQA